MCLARIVSWIMIYKQVTCSEMSRMNTTPLLATLQCKIWDEFVVWGNWHGEFYYCKDDQSEYFDYILVICTAFCCLIHLLQWVVDDFVFRIKAQHYCGHMTISSVCEPPSLVSRWRLSPSVLQLSDFWKNISLNFDVQSSVSRWRFSPDVL